MKISGVLTIKDGIYLGYPFLEAILSVLPIVDEFLINDGGSQDGTFETLEKLRRAFSKIKIFRVGNLDEIDPSVKSSVADLEAKVWSGCREVEVTYTIMSNLLVAVYEGTWGLIILIIEGPNVSLAEYWKAMGLEGG